MSTDWEGRRLSPILGIKKLDRARESNNSLFRSRTARAWGNPRRKLKKKRGEVGSTKKLGQSCSGVNYIVVIYGEWKEHWGTQENSSLRKSDQENSTRKRGKGPNVGDDRFRIFRIARC